MAVRTLLPLVAVLILQASPHRTAARHAGHSQGINRLGAGPRKPGIARPVDPNRFIVQDLVPEGVENDQDYKRMVQDVRCGCALQAACAGCHYLC